MRSQTRPQNFTVAFAYRESRRKPVFNVSENVVQVVLPVTEERGELSDDEMAMFGALKGRELAMSAIVLKVGFGKAKVQKLLKSLIEKGHV